MNFNNVIKILGGNFYKIFYCRIEESFKQNSLIEVDYFGLLIESKKRRQFLSNIGQVSGWDGLFLCDKKLNSNENSIFLVKKEGEKRIIYQLDYDYYEVDNTNMAPLLKQYNHNAYKIREVAEPEIITNFYIEKEVETMDEIDLKTKIGTF